MDKEIKGLLIDFEGLDFSFKETNSKELYNYIQRNVTNKVKLISFPNYTNQSSRLVKRYLNNDFGQASELNPYMSSLFYLTDRIETINDLKIKELLDKGWIVILDRYVNSNIMFQAAKISSEEGQDSYIDRIIDLEYNKCCLPKPDVVIYMDMPLSVSKDMIIARAKKTNIEHDGHEENFEYLEKVHKCAYRLCDKFKWNIIRCTENGHIKSSLKIFNEIKDILYKKYHI